MKYFLASFVTFFLIPAFAQVELCSSDRAQYLRNLEVQSAKVLNHWQQTLVQKYQATPGLEQNRTQKDLALDIVLCTKEKLERGLIYHCVSDPKRGGWTLPVVGRRVYLSEENFWPERISYQKAVIIHEATHKCGTNDAAYFKSTESPHNVGIFGWSTIADTYSFWSQRGICLPGIDCP